MTNFSKKWKNGQWNAWSAGQPDYKDWLKHKHMASKFNPGVKMMKKSQGNNYLFKKQLLRTNFSGCARITKCAQ